jgi:hypothetical protein
MHGDRRGPTQARLARVRARLGIRRRAHFTGDFEVLGARLLQDLQVTRRDGRLEVKACGRATTAPVQAERAARPHPRPARDHGDLGGATIEDSRPENARAEGEAKLGFERRKRGQPGTVTACQASGDKEVDHEARRRAIWLHIKPRKQTPRRDLGGPLLGSHKKNRENLYASPNINALLIVKKWSLLVKTGSGWSP